MNSFVSAVAEDKAEVESPSVAKALIYLRVSSTQQAEKDYNAEGYSLPAQRTACVRKAESLEATVVEEFVERGESGTTANRPALRRMLARLSAGDVQYVIVHKVDRLARNRADDVAIVMAIRKAGAVLVSVSENIDETPSGLLLHGIMSSIAEFYSQNLGLEVKKGSTEKAKRGGTPFKAPLGYVNAREIVDGREIRTIAIDPERGPLVTEAFALYATGQFSLSQLGAILEAGGLRGRSTRQTPGRALGTNRLATMLRNDYYVGTLRYAGMVYEGRHPKLVDRPTFEAVQTELDAHRKSGERNWRHHSYLRGTVYCDECGGRLIYTRANGAGGTYEYFVCRGRQEGTCSQPHHRVPAVELAIEKHYAKVQLKALNRDDVRRAVSDYVASLDASVAPTRTRVTETLRRLDGQERKLLDAHYAEEVSKAIFSEEQRRIQSERAAAEKLQSELDFDHREVLGHLEVALELTDRLQDAYRLSKPLVRRLFNQAIFKGIWIKDEGIARVELKEPFDEFIAISYFYEVVRSSRPRRPAQLNWVADSQASPGNARTPTTVSSRGSSNVESMVRMRGLEPPRSFLHTDLNRARLPIPPHPPEAPTISHPSGPATPELPVVRICGPARPAVGRSMSNGWATGGLLGSLRPHAAIV
jgi:site-specific DNA recombinase